MFARSKIIDAKTRKQIIRNIIIFALISCIINIVIFTYAVYDLSKNNRDRAIEFIKNNEELRDTPISIHTICRLMSCKLVRDDKIFYEVNEYKKWAPSIKDMSPAIHPPLILFQWDDIYFTSSFLVGIKLNVAGESLFDKDLENVSVFFPLPDEANILLIILTSLLFFSAMHILAFLFNLAYSVKLAELMMTVGREAELSNKNMSILTENLHHEFKTPLAVLSSEFEILKNILLRLRDANKDYLHLRRREVDRIIADNSSESFGGENHSDLDWPIIECHEQEFCKAIRNDHSMDDSFNLIKLNLEAINTVSERMKNFKQIKYSNGDQTVYSISDAALNTLKFYNDIKYAFMIDNNLKQFKLRGLANGDLLNILINHIKNSLEANATFIHIIGKSFYTESGLLELLILDNGNGIPASVINTLFDLNVSSKCQTQQRGVGLYICKSILQQHGGDEQVLETGKTGTTFRLKIPVIKK